MPPAPIERPQPGVLVVKIGSHDHVPLSLVAELLGALARDYRRITGGRELTVESVHQGTLTAFLRDLSDWADQANHLFDFTKNIAAIAAAAIAGTIYLRGRKRQDGSDTLLAVAKVAIADGRPVRLAYDGRSGDCVLDVGQAEAGVIRGRALKSPDEDMSARKAPELPMEALEQAVIRAAEDEDYDGVSTLVRELVGIIRQRPEGQRQIDGAGQSGEWITE